VIYRTIDMRPWRCRSCGALLGMHRQAELHIKYKELHAVVVGAARTTCRRCATANATHTASAPSHHTDEAA
jgi:hypothetical protein